MQRMLKVEYAVHAPVDRNTVIAEIDDEEDEDIMAITIDKPLPDGGLTRFLFLHASSVSCRHMGLQLHKRTGTCRMHWAAARFLPPDRDLPEAGNLPDQQKRGSLFAFVEVMHQMALQWNEFFNVALEDVVQVRFRQNYTTMV